MVLLRKLDPFLLHFLIFREHLQVGELLLVFDRLHDAIHGAGQEIRLDEHRSQTHHREPTQLRVRGSVGHVVTKILIVLKRDAVGLPTHRKPRSKGSSTFPATLAAGTHLRCGARRVKAGIDDDPCAILDPLALPEVEPGRHETNTSCGSVLKPSTEHRRHLTAGTPRMEPSSLWTLFWTFSSSFQAFGEMSNPSSNLYLLSPTTRSATIDPPGIWVRCLSSSPGANNNAGSALDGATHALGHLVKPPRRRRFLQGDQAYCQ